jgi:hypothetical protein
MTDYRYKKQIVGLLNEIILALQEKKKAKEAQIETVDKSKMPEKEWMRKLRMIEQDYAFVCGQLYEANYILETITRK